MTATYRSIAQPATAEIVERKSRFIALAAPVASEEAVFELVNTVREQHPEARHHVWAYLLQNGRERCSDDGEPQKTAGLPTLEVIRRSNLVDVAIVTTRYFGGTLLGTGGLVRAYTTAAQEALLKVAQPVEFTRCIEVVCRLPYGLYEQVRHLAIVHGGKPGDGIFNADVVLPVLFKEDDAAPFMGAISELARGQELCLAGAPRFCAF